MKKNIQFDLTMQQKSTNKPIQVQPWVNTALNAKTTPKNMPQASGRMLELNMNFCKSILNRR